MRGMNDEPVWVGMAVFRDNPRWDDEGLANLTTYIDGVAATADLAKAYARRCSAAPVRWFRAKQYADWIGIHKDREGYHFHWVDQQRIDTEIGEHGWPRHAATA